MLLFSAVLVAWWKQAPVLLLALPVVLALCFTRGQLNIESLGCDQRGWWCQYGDKTRSFQPRAGSVRRPDMVKLQYGRWFWQYWLLYPQQFQSAEDFQQLRRCLYLQ
ncbi:hypothetical protein [Bacterioplanes sanyensis]|uniref:hypothetical protein n=1 Tax=Bacterioplanes sanyensis TaxID=1249553 RepID=UPI0012FD1B6A|nr:hypothetical protein [Bacterioplanes sanyensis]